MELTQMVDTIGAELEHIADDERGSPQNVLRFLYNAHRYRDLGRDPSTPASASLRRALFSANKFYPSFAFSFDDEYFLEGVSSHA